MDASDRSTGSPRPMPLEDLAEHCLAAREIIDGLDDPALRVAIDLLLLEVGRALARSLPRDGPGA